MTYNFDPDLWYRNQRLALEARRAKGELNDEEFAAALEDLDRRYDDMLTRIDRSFELPGRPH